MASLSSILTFVAILAFLLALAAAGVYLYKTAYPDQPVRFFTSRMRRLEFVERAHLGGGRKLLLVRRDNVEHLLLIGGPIDLVVETGIRPEIITLQETVEEGSNDASHKTRASETRESWKVRNFPLASRLDLAISSLRSPKEQDFKSEMPEPKLSMSSKKDDSGDSGPVLTTMHEAKPVSSN